MTDRSNTDDFAHGIPPSVVTMEGISLVYPGGISALKGITLALAPGSFTFVTGGSGAGKTSLLRILGLAQKPSEGALSILGHDVASQPRRARAALRRRIGMVFQDFRLLNHLTVLDNAMLPLRIAGVDSATCQAQAKELLAWVGLGDRMGAFPPALSGGQQQRVAIARAVIGKPQLLLADEPTGSVDEEIGFRLLSMFQALNREGTTVVIASHDVQLVRQLGYPQIVLRDGQLVPSGPAAAQESAAAE